MSTQVVLALCVLVAIMVMALLGSVIRARRARDHMDGDAPVTTGTSPAVVALIVAGAAIALGLTVLLVWVWIV